MQKTVNKLTTHIDNFTVHIFQPEITTWAKIWPSRRKWPGMTEQAEDFPEAADPPPKIVVTAASPQQEQQGTGEDKVAAQDPGDDNEESPTSPSSSAANKQNGRLQGPHSPQKEVRSVGGQLLSRKDLSSQGGQVQITVKGPARKSPDLGIKYAFVGKSVTMRRDAHRQEELEAVGDDINRWVAKLGLTGFQEDVPFLEQDLRTGFLLAQIIELIMNLPGVPNAERVKPYYERHIQLRDQLDPKSAFARQNIAVFCKCASLLGAQPTIEISDVSEAKLPYDAKRKIAYCLLALASVGASHGMEHMPDLIREEIQRDPERSKSRNSAAQRLRQGEEEDDEKSSEPSPPDPALAESQRLPLDADDSDAVKAALTSQVSELESKVASTSQELSAMEAKLLAEIEELKQQNMEANAKLAKHQRASCWSDWFSSRSLASRQEEEEAPQAYVPLGLAEEPTDDAPKQASSPHWGSNTFHVHWWLQYFSRCTIVRNMIPNSLSRNRRD
eukprot:g7391.t1